MGWMYYKRPLQAGKEKPSELVGKKNRKKGRDLSQFIAYAFLPC